MLTLALLALAAQGPIQPQAIRGERIRPTRPGNVLLVLIDDVGIDQLSVYDDQNGYTDPKGYPYASTPTIDSLVSNGVRFNQARICPTCSPSRASLLSGSYPFRHGIGSSPRDPNDSHTAEEFARFPSPEVITLPAFLRSAGYRSVGAVGKWHLGEELNEQGTMDTHPTDVGFDTWEGTMRNLDSTPAPPDDPRFEPGYYSYWWADATIRAHVTGEDIVERTFDRATTWVQTASEPWFLYIATNACHAPFDETNWPGYGHGFGVASAGPDSTNTAFRARLEHLDTQLGEFIAENPGLTADTTIILIGDNGTPEEVIQIGADDKRYPIGHPLWQQDDQLTAPSTAPYDRARFKRTAYEGGVRVPMIVMHPGGMRGVASQALVDGVDVFRTIAALQRLPLPVNAGVDSQSFADSILPGQTLSMPRSWSLGEFFKPNGTDPANRVIMERFYLRLDGASVWKLIHRRSPVESFEFYDLSSDPLETNELGTAHPDYAQTLSAYLTLTGG